MRIIRGLHNLHRALQGGVATIGNFDGVHLGHQAMLVRLRACAREVGVCSTLILFEPQPMEFFTPNTAPARLSRLREKLHEFLEQGLDQVVILHFNHTLAHLSAEDFIRRVLIEGLNIRHLFVGDDFRFGHQRRGNLELLHAAGARHGFAVSGMETRFDAAGARISSSRIRAALADGDLETATQCMGRSYCIHGRVAHGDKRGRTLGFPTANIHLRRIASPLHGVFAVRVHGIGPQPRAGVANIGSRPTVDGGSRYVLEVHVFDFAQSIYGRHVAIEFVAHLRDEQRFPDLEALRAQIHDDCRQARILLSGGVDRPL